MKSMLQSQPTTGPATPYRRDEWIRTTDKGGWLEIELAARESSPTAPPLAYFLLNLIPGQGQSIALAVPGGGLDKLIEVVTSHKVYIQAFRRYWPIFDNLYVDGQQLPAEAAKRPVLVTVKDLETGQPRWMVATQVAVPANAPNARMTQAELEAAQSLIMPTLQLQAQAKDAGERVTNAFIRKEFEAPQGKFWEAFDKYQKFHEDHETAFQILDAVIDALKSAGGGG